MYILMTSCFAQQLIISPPPPPPPHTHTHPYVQPDGKPSGETVLANFFNSLLSKKQTGGKGTGSMRGSRSEARNEAAAELDRMQSKKPGTKS